MIFVMCNGLPLRATIPTIPGVTLTITSIVRKTSTPKQVVIGVVPMGSTFKGQRLCVPCLLIIAIRAHPTRLVLTGVAIITPRRGVDHHNKGETQRGGPRAGFFSNFCHARFAFMGHISQIGKCGVRVSVHSFTGFISLIPGHRGIQRHYQLIIQITRGHHQVGDSRRGNAFTLGGFTILLYRFGVKKGCLLYHCSTRTGCSFQSRGPGLLPRPRLTQFLLRQLQVTIFQQATFCSVYCMSVFVSIRVRVVRVLIRRLSTSTRGQLTHGILIFAKSLTSRGGLNVLKSRTRGGVHSHHNGQAFVALWAIFFGFFG